MDETSREIVERLKNIEGHIRGIQRMVENGEYCIAVVNQVLAVQRALHKVNRLVLDRHLHTCARMAMDSQDAAEREKVIAEIMEVFEATGKL